MEEVDKSDGLREVVLSANAVNDLFRAAMATCN